jgi:hypothetical protein
MTHSTHPYSLRYAIAIGATALALSMAPSTSHAFLGLLGKLGSAAGKAGAVGKGAAAGGAAVAGAEIAQGANAAGKAAKLGAAGEGGAAAANSADDIARASGLGKAVPDDIAAMMTTKGKTLLDVPDPGTRAWLGTPVTQAESYRCRFHGTRLCQAAGGQTRYWPCQSH